MIEQLRIADNVVSQAYPMLEKAEQIRDEAIKKKKISKILWILLDAYLAIFISVIITFPISLISRDVWNYIFPVLAIPVGIVLYKFFTVPRINNKFSTRMQEVNTLFTQAEKLYNDNIEALSIIPADYQFPLASNYIRKMVETGRATTMNQALQMCDEQLHRWKMESTNSEILNQQMSINRNTGISAAANTISAVANVARLFK